MNYAGSEPGPWWEAGDSGMPDGTISNKGHLDCLSASQCQDEYYN
jgi:hypothetical protein